VNGGRAKELATRQTDGVVVSLHWRRADDKLTVTVDDTRTGERFRVPARRENALEVFYHPFAYAAEAAA
jgi:hypothetical protein